MSVWTFIAAVFLGIPACWLGLVMSKWSAPIACAVGFFLFVAGVYTANGRLMGYGAGLFGFCSLIFIVAGHLDLEAGTERVRV